MSEIFNEDIDDNNDAAHENVVSNLEGTLKPNELSALGVRKRLEELLEERRLKAELEDLF